MPLGSYHVLGTHYIAPPLSVKVTPKKIAPEDHRSHMFITNTQSSWPYDQSLPSQPHFARGSHGELVAFEKTSSKLPFFYDDYPMNGRASPQIDDFNQYVPNSFGTWLDAGEKYGPNSFSYVKVPSWTNAMVSLGERKAEFHYGDTPIPKYVSDISFEGRLNGIGPALSRIHGSVTDKLNSYLGTRNGRELASYLKSLGHSPEDIGWVGTGFLPHSAIYGVDRLSDGKILLTAAEDAYDKVVKDAKLLGVDPDVLLASIFAEELTHIWRGDFDKEGSNVAIEMSAKEIVARHYDRLAKGADGDPKKVDLKSRYRRVAAIKRHDRDTTPERYGKHSSHYKELYSKDRASLELMLEMDAMEEGYRGGKAREYVASRLMEIENETDNPQRGSRLETIAKEGKETAKPEKESLREDVAEATAETA